MFTREILKSRNIVRIGQKPDVEYQIAIRRQALPKTEAGHINHDVGLVPPPAEALSNKFPELVNRELGSIDRQVRHLTDGSEQRPLAADALRNRSIGTQRMGPARLAKAPDDRLVLR